MVWPKTDPSRLSWLTPLAQGILLFNSAHKLETNTGFLLPALQYCVWETSSSQSEGLATTRLWWIIQIADFGGNHTKRLDWRVNTSGETHVQLILLSEDPDESSLHHWLDSSSKRAVHHKQQPYNTFSTVCWDPSTHWPATTLSIFQVVPQKMYLTFSDGVGAIACWNELESTLIFPKVVKHSSKTIGPKHYFLSPWFWCLYVTYREVYHMPSNHL